MFFHCILSFFNLASLVEFKILENLDSFIGLNFNLPMITHSPFKLLGDMGFQGGAGYNVFKHIWLEALVKVNNMNLYNNRGEKRDVSLAGLELKGPLLILKNHFLLHFSQRP